MTVCFRRLSLLLAALALLSACGQKPPAKPPEEPPPPTAEEPATPPDAPAPPAETQPPAEEPEPAPTPPPMTEFDHTAPGILKPGTNHDHGDTGISPGQRLDALIPDGMRFPMKHGPAFANSQIFGYGGGGFAGFPPPDGGNGMADTRNYDYPWTDNFCEVRDYEASGCASNLGHQGQDIRPSTCWNAHYWAVAVEDGTIAILSDKTLQLEGDQTGLYYWYLHLDRPLPAEIVNGAHVSRGDRLGLVSNVTISGGAISHSLLNTMVHLHFEIRAANAQGKLKPVAPYATLVEAYRARLQADPSQKDPIPQADGDTSKCAYNGPDPEPWP